VRVRERTDRRSSSSAVDGKRKGMGKESDRRVTQRRINKYEALFDKTAGQGPCHLLRFRFTDCRVTVT